MKPLESLLGANWRTTLTGWITVAASAIAIKPELVAFLPDPPRGWITGTAGLIAVLSGGTFAAQAKDRQVTGGTMPNDPPASHSGILPVALFAAVTLMVGCATLSRWQANATVQKAETEALRVVERVALDCGLAAIEQYASTGGVNARAVGAAALNGAAAELRSLEATTASANPAAVENAIRTGAGVNAVAHSVAPVVATAVVSAIQEGVNPDAAVEKSATALDAAAAKVRVDSVNN